MAAAKTIQPPKAINLTEIAYETTVSMFDAIDPYLRSTGRRNGECRRLRGERVSVPSVEKPMTVGESSNGQENNVGFRADRNGHYASQRVRSGERRHWEHIDWHWNSNRCSWSGNTNQG